MSKIRSYSQLQCLETFEERFDYLKLGGEVGAVTFGFDRWLNQSFYKSREWRDARNHVIVRDGGCDLGVAGHEIFGGLVVHHINPMSVEDLERGEEWIFNPDFLIVTCHDTHNAIHYGDSSLLPRGPIVRQPGDTNLW